MRGAAATVARRPPGCRSNAQNLEPRPCSRLRPRSRPAARAAAWACGVRSLARSATVCPRSAPPSGARLRKPCVMCRSRAAPRPRRSRAPLTPCRTRWTRRRRCAATARRRSSAVARATQGQGVRCDGCATPDAAPARARRQVEESCKPQCVKALLAYQARPSRAGVQALPTHGAERRNPRSRPAPSASSGTTAARRTAPASTLTTGAASTNACVPAASAAFAATRVAAPALTLPRGHAQAAPKLFARLK